MDWVIAVMVFLVQLLCCIYVENKLLRLLPSAVVVAVMVLTLMFAGGFGALGFIGAIALLIPMSKSLLMAVLAWVLYKMVLFTK